jgi:hypothetical protein
VSESGLPPLLERLPAQCRELKQTAQQLLVQNKFASRTGERRKGALTLVGE